MRSADDLTAVARIRDAAIELVGERGFGVGLRTIAQKAGVSAALVIHHFGSKDNLLRACDEYIADQIRETKTESLRTPDPADWLRQVAEIDSYAPMIGYLVRSMQTGGELAKAFWQRMVDNAEQYLEEGVRSGTLKPSPDPKARARFLGISSGGGLLLYLLMNNDQSDLRAVLRDYAEEMVLPALEVYTNGLMTDSTMYEAFRAQREQGIPLSPPIEGDHDDGTVAAMG
ncbi:TetR family transcriptional regulator [Mycolicibacterium agri]|uniref:TetR family transcriptional regulator n=1 Tax=Mycolicibacterium agri TaxID=36811 RepID=A0A2A7N1L0_MYCAG|nr:TetR family transcriptional regulator [Mycolicibacterium agri]PEG37932.1 TetR family transcriptional regulator [Mycolicibacterium agri]GFG54645.1 TetR family transcriptional regulator [Mycolicibacterium agri]